MNTTLGPFTSKQEALRYAETYKDDFEVELLAYDSELSPEFYLTLTLKSWWKRRSTEVLLLLVLFIIFIFVTSFYFFELLFS